MGMRLSVAQTTQQKEVLPNCEMNYTRTTTGHSLSGIQHYNDVIMGKMASQITSLTIVYSIVYLSADLRKHQSPALLALCAGEFTGLRHKEPITRKMFPFDDVIMQDLGCDGDREGTTFIFLNIMIQLHCPFMIQLTPMTMNYHI